MSFIKTLLRLSPFLASSIYFFLEYVEKTSSMPNYAIFKCIPTASLCFFVLTSNHNSSYSNKIFFGLFVSTLGDAILCYPEQALYGIGAFAIAQLTYINAFGFRQMRYDFGALVLLVLIGSYFYLYPFLLLKDPQLKYGIMVYMSLLFTMIWRALARFDLCGQEDHLNLAGSTGAILFGISDLALFFDYFVRNLPNGNYIVMLTYYGAQAGIALTTSKYKFD